MTFQFIRGLWREGVGAGGWGVDTESREALGTLFVPVDQSHMTVEETWSTSGVTDPRAQFTDP